MRHATVLLLTALLIVPAAAAFVPTGADETRLPEGETLQSWYGVLTPPSREDPALIAQRFLDDHQTQLGITLGTLEKKNERASLTATHHRFQQVVEGVPVVGAEVSVHILHDGTVWVVHSDVVQAVEAGAPLFPLAVAERLALARVPGLVLDARAVLVADGRVGHPAWEVFVEPAGNTYTSWTVHVSRLDGSVLQAFDNSHYASATGYVWTDPLRASGDADLRGDFVGSDAVQDLNQYMFEVTVDNLESLGGVPYLWGPYVRVMELARGGDDFRVDRLDPRFEEFMAYYWIDASQQYMQSLGFEDDKAIVDYPIMVFPHALAGVHNAFYSTALPPGTGSGHLAFGWRAPCVVVVVTGVQCDPSEAALGPHAFSDIAEGADVILHEYGHAVLDNQVPGISGREGMHEGWADYWALTQLEVFEDSHFDDCVGTWFGAHLRPGPHGEPYCIRVLINNVTYEDIEGQGVHFSGQLISGALWNLRAQIGNHSVADQIWLEGNFLMPQSGGLHRAAEAYLMADLALHGGDHTHLIFDEFASRNVTELDLTPEVVAAIADARVAAEAPVDEGEPARRAAAPAIAFVALLVAGAAAVARRRQE